MDYPDRNLTIEVLLDAARRAANESPADHPEDIAAAMVGSLDGAVSAILYLHRDEAPDV